MKKIQITILVALPVCFLVMSSSVSAESAREIMDKYDKVYRESYSTFYNKMELSTCKYTVKTDRMVCTEKPRIVVLEGSRKFYGKDYKSTALVLEPISDKGIGLLFYEYYDSGKDNDNWTYLPALGKVKRIIASNEDNDGSGSFLGTEFSTEDMQTFKLDSYTYKLLGEETYENRPAWILELIPTPEKARKTAYGKIIIWMDKERHIRFREDLYNHNGKLYKRYTLKNYELVDNVWLARILMMNNLISRRVTIISTPLAAYDVEIPDEFYTHRVLNDIVFREKNMVKLRKYLK